MSVTKHYSKRGKVASAIDTWLDDLGYYRKNVAYDETCLFRAVSEQMFYTQIYHERVRKECIEYAKENYKQFIHLFNNEEDSLFVHLEELANHMIVCGYIELEIISLKYNRDIVVFDAVGQTVMDVTERKYTDVLLLCRISEDHFDVVYKCDHIATAGFCQSIVYKILYENVFGTPDVDEIVNLMLYEKPQNIVSCNGYFNSINKSPGIDGNGECSSSNRLENASECYPYDEDVFVAPFPFKIAKALDPSIYRNIEYDTWTEVRREMRLGDWYYGDHNLILGTSCNLKNGNESVQCYIQEILKEENKCIVYITSLAQRRTVNYSDLVPEDDAKPWPLPYRFSKNLVLTPTSPAPQTEKDKKCVRKRKDKKRPKNLDLHGVQSTSAIDAVEHNVTAYEGCPLRMQSSVPGSNNHTAAIPDQSAEIIKTDVPNDKKKECQYVPESFQWPTVLPSTPESYWPQTPMSPVTPHNVFTFTKPVYPALTTSVSSDVVTYAPENGGVHYYYNYTSEDYNSGQESWNNNNSERVFDPKQDAVPNEVITTENADVTYATVPSYITYTDNAYGNQPQLNMSMDEGVQTNISTHPQSSPHVYPAAIYPLPLSQHTPIFYTSPDVKDLVVPQHSPLPVYTPPIFSPPIYTPSEVQFVSTPYVYPPTPPTAWYQPGINAQGFIFPQPFTTQNVVPNGM